MRRRIYAAEAPIYANEAPHKGRSRVGKPIIRARSRDATKYTLHVYAKKDRVLHWDLSDQNADTKEIERVAVDAATQMSVGDTVIWEFGAEWASTLLTSTPARLCERSSRNVACQ